MERETLNRVRLDALLRQLEAVGGAATWALPPRVSQPDGAPWVRRGPVAAALERSPTGGVVFVEGDGGWVVAPPFPVAALDVRDGWDGSALRHLLHTPLTIGAVLLRLEGYSVGLFRGEALLESRTGGRWIHGRNRAGGQSQHRFEHTRDKHIRELFDDACQAARDKFEPHRGEIDWIALGGDRLTLQGFRQRCAYIEGYGDRILPGVVNIVAPKRDTLERFPYELMKCQVLRVLPGESGEMGLLEAEEERFPGS